MRTVILTDATGKPTGCEEIVKAHKEGHLHKAFSIFIFRKQGSELLIQQRSKDKMLFPGYWANSCCSHPLENEETVAAGKRRLKEECGFTVPLLVAGSFVYRAEDTPRDMTEHEHDTVLVGIGDDVEVIPNPDEIAEWQWIGIDNLQSDLKNHPEKYAPWLSQALNIACEQLNNATMSHPLHEDT